MENVMTRNDRMETLVSLSKRRGIVFPSSEIYGGLRAAWDYGPLGVEIKNNIKRQWWRSMVHERDDIVGLDSSVILATEVWQASGHVTEFTDPLTECMSCHPPVPGRPPARGLRGEARAPAGGRPGPDRLPALRHQGRLHRAAQFQRAAAYLPGRDRGRLGAGVPAARDRSGHLHQLQERPADLAQEAAVRDRADRQVVPQRDHPR
jgi:hypothetical protein